jgi:monofunctional biosynthetic peptidoglycan transglycosylase
VVASEDAGVTEQRGVDWDALQRAWDRNRRSEARADATTSAAARHATASAATTPARAGAPPKIVGGSTITQQLAKNLFLDGERDLLRKAQEFLITVMLETFVSKARILEIYLNSVEWGEGVFGADAAAHRYFGIEAAGLNAAQAAQLAVMLPAPKRFERRPSSPYVLSRAATVSARMGAVDLP